MPTVAASRTRTCLWLISTSELKVIKRHRYHRVIDSHRGLWCHVRTHRCLESHFVSALASDSTRIPWRCYVRFRKVIRAWLAKSPLSTLRLGSAERARGAPSGFLCLPEDIEFQIMLGELHYPPIRSKSATSLQEGDRFTSRAIDGPAPRLIASAVKLEVSQHPVHCDAGVLARYRPMDCRQ
jgi:hypothetical protein